ncbi:MAG: hypothetical protein K8U03_14880 [Planctomycetia bacterium]|nr:hypothetical protein [Planctomycetia bacterium]
MRATIFASAEPPPARSATPPRTLFVARGLCAALLWSALGVASASAVEPTIRLLDVRGLQLGGTTTLIIDGDDLGPLAPLTVAPPAAAVSPAAKDAKVAAKDVVVPVQGPRLMLPFAAKQELKKGATDKRAVFDVTLADDIAPGYYNLRLTTDGGVSLPVVIAVDRMIQRPLAPETTQLPAALHGTASGSVPLETKFTGKAGERFMAEVESQRLGGKLRPVVHLYGPKRAQIGWSWPSPALYGDTRLMATLPTDGTYTVAVHDLEYAAPASSYFRLRLGRWSSADQVFPPVVKSGGRATFELVGSSPPERIDMASMPGSSTLPFPAPKSGLWSGPRPFVQTSSCPELIEQPTSSPPGNVQELPSGPVGVSGRLLKPGEEDRYRIAVAPNTKLRLEVFAERNGSPVDTAIVIRGEKDALLTRGEDGVGTIDPVLEYTVPDKTTSLVVGVVDAQGRGGVDATYRLFIEPASGGPGDFRLSTAAQRLTLPAGGRVVVPVVAERRGYAGEIEVTAQGLPAGVKLEGGKIPAEADGTLVTIERTGPLADAAITEWQGRAAGDVVRPVVLKGHPAERLQPWLATELAIAPTGASAGPFTIQWRGLPADARLIPAQKLTLPFEVVRPDVKADDKGNKPADTTTVRLSLVTSQLAPLVNNQPDLPKTLRVEKPVELAPKVGTGEIVVLIPPEIMNPTYDVSVQAELLAADKKTVLATSFAPVKRLPLSLPVALKLNGPVVVPAALDAKTGAKLELKGKIERREGAVGEVTVALTGLPPTIAAVAPVIVKADANDFTLNLVLPPTTPAGKIAGLKLSASLAPDAKQPAVRVRSRDTEFAVVVEPSSSTPKK